MARRPTPMRSRCVAVGPLLAAPARPPWAASSVLWQCESADEVPRRSAPRLSRHMRSARSGWGLCVPPPRAQWVREAPATSVVGAFTGPPGSRRLRFLPRTPQGLGSSPLQAPRRGCSRRLRCPLGSVRPAWSAPHRLGHAEAFAVPSNSRSGTGFAPPCSHSGGAALVG